MQMLLNIYIYILTFVNQTKCSLMLKLLNVVRIPIKKIQI